MSVNNRIARIKAGGAASSMEWNERSVFEASQRAAVGIDVREPEIARFGPKSVTVNLRRIVFVDFCPGGVVGNRQDVSWIKQGVCTYESFANDEQWELFQSIEIGDLLVMKKTTQHTRTMLLQAYGKVFGYDLTERRDRVLLVNWSYEKGQLEVPLMGGDNMVVSYAPGDVMGVMPTDFWRWLRN